MNLSEKFWAQAKDLADQAQNASGDTQETLYRSAISRAYYASFHHVRDIAFSDQSFEPHHNPRVHADVCEVAKKYNGRIADELGRFKDIRNMADYDTVISNLPTKWNTAKQTAERCFAHIKPLKK